MIVMQGKLLRGVHIACSGGVDSMAVTDFLRQNHDCTLLFFDHDTQTSRDSLEFLSDYVSEKNGEFRQTPTATRLELKVGNITARKPKSESWEEYWRNQRYSFFHSISDSVISCHHLDDCVETWIWTSLNGKGKIIPYSNRNVIRPFRLNRKEEFQNWCRRKGVSWVDDTTNEDTKYIRNYIRKELMPKCLVVNPGIHKVVRKKVEKDFTAV